MHASSEGGNTRTTNHRGFLCCPWRRRSFASPPSRLSRCPICILVLLVSIYRRRRRRRRCRRQRKRPSRLLPSSSPPALRAQSPRFRSGEVPAEPRVLYQRKSDLVATVVHKASPSVLFSALSSCGRQKSGEESHVNKRATAAVSAAKRLRKRGSARFPKSPTLLYSLVLAANPSLRRFMFPF